MTLGFIRHAVIMLAALSLSFGLGHLIELPARMAWDQYLWVGATVQGGLYALSGPLGVLVQVATVVAMIVLAILLRRHRASGFPFTVAAAAMFAMGLLIWWILVYRRMSSLPNGSMSPCRRIGLIGGRCGSGDRRQTASPSSLASRRSSLRCYRGARQTTAPKQSREGVSG
jgi:hypothetical protein